MDMLQLDPKAKSMWRVTRLIGLAFILLCDVGIYFIILKNIESLSPVVVLLIIAVPVAFQVLNIVLYPPIEYRQWTYLITGDRIEIKKGIFFHSTRVIPISRIQHVTIVEGPIARLFGLSTVTINTAGGAFRIEGLSKATAETICDNLKDVVNRKIGIR
jgi:membrane protein YdbS with pleckstrin-like domain